MQLSLHSDYSCRVLIYLAMKADDDLASIEEIATAYRISRNHLVKIVHKLGQAGFVETIRGRQGGLRIGRNPKDIRIGDVIRVMEPNLDIVECFNETKNNCVISPACTLKMTLHKARSAFFAELDAVTLAMVVSNRSALKSLVS